jgi:hypothetical protein
MTAEREKSLLNFQQLNAMKEQEHGNNFFVSFYTLWTNGMRLFKTVFPVFKEKDKEREELLLPLSPLLCTDPSHPWWWGLQWLRQYLRKGRSESLDYVQNWTKLRNREEF